MHYLKKLALAVALVALSAAGASAADLTMRKAAYTKAPPMAPAYNWSGFYIGLNGGGGSSHGCQTLIADIDGPHNPLPEGCNNAVGGLLGGQAGYRWQQAMWVFGLEAQGDWANLKGQNFDLTSSPTYPFQRGSKVDAIGLFTGQVGYALNNVLFYAKGGAAVTHNKYTVSPGFNNGPYPAGSIEESGSSTRWGGVIGAGIEYGFAPNWSVAIEYDHLFMGKQDTSLYFLPPSTGFAETDSTSQDIDIGTIRLNYKFGGPVVAKY